MRITIVIDERLLAEAMSLTGAPTKRAAVEQSLKLLIQMMRQGRALNDLTGVGWEGDLDTLRGIRQL